VRTTQTQSTPHNVPRATPRERKPRGTPYSHSISYPQTPLWASGRAPAVTRRPSGRLRLLILPRATCAQPAASERPLTTNDCGPPFLEATSMCGAQGRGGRKRAGGKWRGSGGGARESCCWVGVVGAQTKHKGRGQGGKRRLFSKNLQIKFKFEEFYNVVEGSSHVVKHT
jgi:hypothetical protein